MFIEDCFIKKPTHHILVRCVISKEHDTRTFTIACDLSTSVIFNHAKRLMINYVKKEKQKLYFEDEKKKTHQIMITKKGGLSKSFQISLSSHSSTDIANILYPYFCGGREKKWKRKNTIGGS
ncbi:MAG: hypothetical protein ACOCP8_09190 [archaeon]